MSEVFRRMGRCQAIVTGKVWRQGHSIRCEKRDATSVRYWKPDKSQYHWGKIKDMDDLGAEIWDFCNFCDFAEEKELG